MTRSILRNTPVSFIGAGAMGEAMIGGLLRHDLVEPGSITASDLHQTRLAEVQQLFQVRTTRDNRVAVRKAKVVVLSVKPQVMSAVYADLQGAIRPTALVVSIVAGARIASIASGLGHRSIVRTMPNTPAQVGEGMTVWTATDAVSAIQREQAGALLGALGKHLYVRDEGFLDKATAVSGSGPAYVFMLMEALIDAAVHLGWSRADARQMVIQTVRGAATFADRSSVHPAEMRNLVTSPGGTTADAIYQLDKGGFRTVLSKAVLAAYQRSVALGALDDDPSTPSPKRRVPRKTSRKTTPRR
ncbi:MAG: pyrroline-5-carboxylate reductase [Acidobacteriota bacterium]|nr:pyrroline-5-carboxylate reductase [Acidobacteriota bacterium]